MIVPISTDLLFSLILHALILFCILTVLFFYVIAPMAKKGINNAVINNAKNNLAEILYERNIVDRELRNFLRTYIPLQKIADFYGAPDEGFLKNNYYMEIVAYVIIAFIASTFIVPALFLFYSADRAISLFKIVIENIAVFAFIGVFEVGFFMLIALKYMPISSEGLVRAIIKGLQE
jgi:hypothetical protein